MIKKKVIGGKIYNIETAKHIGERQNGFYPSDHSYFEEDLYLKRTGEFFLAGKGGGLTKYAEHYGNTRSEGSRIIPLTIKEAKAWVEEHLDADIYIELFGEPEE